MMNPFEEKIAAIISENQLIRAGERVLVGVSGGPDSMALLCVLLALKQTLDLSLLAVHVHHGIRDQAADDDAAFVEDFCKANHVPYILEKTDVPALAAGRHESLETVGREERRRIFFKLAESHRCDKIALAHHKNDQAETVLMRLARGTGPAGACGMPLRSGRIIRPFLPVSKTEILAYLDEKKITFRTDATNADVKFSRNRIRKEVLPALEKAHPGATAHIAAFADSQRKMVAFAKKQAAARYEKLLTFDALGRRTFDIAALLREDAFIKEALIRGALSDASGTAVDIEARHINLILNKLNEAKETTWDLFMPHGVMVRRRYNGLIFEAKAQRPRPFSGCYAIGWDQLIADAADGLLITVTTVANTAKKSLSNSQNPAQIPRDCAKIKSDIDLLVLRRRTAADFVVHGGKHKRLKRFLIDKKVDRDLRDALPVLAKDNRILWMPGVFIDETCRAAARSEKYLIVRLEKLR